MQTNLKAQSDENLRKFSKPRTISERLADAAKSTFVGRKTERALISNAVKAAELPFMVTFIHGPGGIGKSRLIRAALGDTGPEVRRYIMDCREIEPTPRGFQIALGAKLEVQESEPDLARVVHCLTEKKQRSVLALDTYETFGLIDTWLRQEFLPSLSDNVFTIIAGREAPNPAWLTTPGWSELFREIKLGELSKEDAQKMLTARGLTASQIEKIKKFAHGFPLALEMAAAAISTRPDLEISDGPPPKIFQQLTDAFLAGLPPETIEAVEAATTVRRVTEPLLRAMLSISDVRNIFSNLQALPFTDVTAEGLVFQEVVRETISKELERRDPERYRRLRKRAYTYFTRESHRAVASTLWQYTADLLYMIENPIARGAFFPEGATDLRVEPATADDAADIHQIAKSRETTGSSRLIELWWQHHPEAFNLVKSPDGQAQAFYIIFEADNVGKEMLEKDPFTAAWLQHLAQNPVEEEERVLFCRRWLDRSSGEIPTPAVGACFLDIERTYMELRPSLRRIYYPVIDLATFEPILFPLGFGALEKKITLGETTYHTLMNDFGPSSIDGWLAKIIGQELGVDITPEQGRVLATVLFTDIVGSTEKAVALGDHRWQKVLEGHHALVRSELAKYQGREIDTAGDGFFAVFEKPAHAINCALAVSRQVSELDLEIRAGLHLGECEVTDDAVRGITVHIGARVAARAKAGEVLLSSTLKDAMAGSEIGFKNRGAYELKGIPGEWSLFAVEP
jgi:class 3 adenylate cyclase